MTPESADQIAYNLVKLDRATGSYRRVQLPPMDERRILDEEGTQRDLNDSYDPSPWSARPR